MLKNQSFTVSHPIKNNNNELVSTIAKKLIARHFHYKFQVSDSSGHGLSSRDFWKDSNALRNLRNLIHQEWEIIQDISYEEILARWSHLPLTLKLVVLMGFQ